MAVMDMEDALVYKVVNTAGVSALIGSRMHPDKLPDTATIPALVYQEISYPVESTHDEAASGALVHPRYQIDAWASTRKGARVLAKALFVALHGFKGIVTSGADSFTFQSILLVDKRQNYDPETKLYWVSQDFMIWYSE